MEKNLDIAIKTAKASKSKAVIEISGYINMDTSDLLVNEIEKIKQKFNPNKYIFILDGLEYISSAGIGIFMELFEFIENQKGRICFVGMSDSVRRVFKLVGFLQYFGDVDTIEEAESFIS